jgi:hypothetical protein
VPFLLQATRDFHRFVSADAAADAKRNEAHGYA